MGAKQFRIGSVSVLFAVVMLCMSVFAVLTVATAKADQSTARRYGEYIRRLNRCQNEGQQWLAEADAYLNGKGDLPQNTEATDKELSTQLQSGEMQLTIRLTAQDGKYEIRQWSCSRQWEAETDDQGVWQGKED